VKERVDSPLRGQAAAVEAPTAEKPARLRLRPLTGWEEEYVERHQADANTARLCNEVLARCLVEPGEHPGGARQAVRELLVAERDRELVELRRISLGPEIKARVSCPSCGEPSDVTFSLETLPLDFDSPPRRLTVEVPEAGEIVLRLPTAGDQEDLADAALEGEAQQRSWLLARCIVRYGNRTGVDIDFARGLPVAVRTALESALERATPELGLEMEAVCAHCGATFAAPFDVPVFFFSS
jgi:hypothetical protein